MTKIADIKSAVEAKLSGALGSSFARIPNPYALDENTMLILRNGYSVAVGSGTNTNRLINCGTSWEREFVVGIVTQVVTTENNTTKRESFIQGILDAHRLVLQAFENDVTLGGLVIEAIVQGDGGLTYIDQTRGKFMAMEISLLVEYLEDL